MQAFLDSALVSDESKLILMGLALHSRGRTCACLRSSKSSCAYSCSCPGSEPCAYTHMRLCICAEVLFFVYMHLSFVICICVDGFLSFQRTHVRVPAPALVRACVYSLARACTCVCSCACTWVGGCIARVHDARGQASPVSLM